MGLAQEIVDQHLGVNLFLDVEGRGVDDEVAPVLLVLSPPDELGVEVSVAWVVHLDGFLFFGPKDRLKLRRWDVLALVGLVFKGLYGLGFTFLGHGYLLPTDGCLMADLIILLNSPSTLALKSDWIS